MRVTTTTFIFLALLTGELGSQSVGRERTPEAPRGVIRYPQPGNPLPRFIERANPTRLKSPSLQLSDKERLLRQKICRNMINNFAVHYNSLKTYLPPSSTSLDSSLAGKISTYTDTHCSSDEQKQVMRDIAQAINSNHRKIGVILPQSGPLAPLAAEIIAGMRKAAETAGIKFDSQVVIRDSHGDPHLAQRALAELVFSHDVTAVIGGMQSQVALALLPWADKLSLPTVLLTSRISIPEGNAMAFRVFPDQRELAQALAKTCKLRSYRNVAVLYPSGTGAETIAGLLEEELKAENITVTETATYQPTDYNSMEIAAKTIFKQHSAGREQEYRNMVWRLRTQARKAGVPFSSRMIVLPPRVTFDAVFIADTFKNVRHMARIFQYLGVNKIPLFGSHEWRSPALVSPYDEFLEGAFFADFIGSYSDLPKELNVPRGSSPLFVNAANAQSYDFNLIGLRSLQIVAKAINETPKRRKIASYMEQMQESGSSYFPIGSVFRENHHSFWPAFVFTVQNRNIYLTSQFRSTHERSAPPTVSSSNNQVLGAPSNESPPAHKSPAPVQRAVPERLFTH